MVKQEKIPQTKLYLDGFIELQDAGSQALVSELNCPERGTVLDYCAGGGGKTLALASIIPMMFHFQPMIKVKSALKN